MSVENKDKQAELYRKVCSFYAKYKLPYPKRPNNNIDWFNIWSKFTSSKNRKKNLYNSSDDYFSKVKALFANCNLEKAEKVKKVKLPRQKKKNKRRKGKRSKLNDKFYSTWEWKQLRYEALQLYGRQCLCCGFTPTAGSKNYLCGDYIKPISKYLKLALDI